MKAKTNNGASVNRLANTTTTTAKDTSALGLVEELMRQMDSKGFVTVNVALRMDIMFLMNASDHARLHRQTIQKSIQDLILSNYAIDFFETRKGEAVSAE